MNFINNVDLVLELAGYVPDALLEITHLVDARVRGTVDLHHVGLDDVQVLAASFPLVLFPLVVVGIKDGRRVSGKVDAVVAMGQPDATRSPPSGRGSSPPTRSPTARRSS